MPGDPLSAGRRGYFALNRVWQEMQRMCPPESTVPSNVVLQIGQRAALMDGPEGLPWAEPPAPFGFRMTEVKGRVGGSPFMVSLNNFFPGSMRLSRFPSLFFGSGYAPFACVTNRCLPRATCRAHTARPHRSLWT